MLLTPYASSSRGNLYEVSDGDTRILAECGLNFKRMQALLPCPVTEYAACLVTHEHKDHSRSASTLLARGVDVYATAGTAAAAGLLPSPRLHPVAAGAQFDLGTLRVKPFATVHDCAEPVGYLIHSASTGERLAFATDTAFVRYRFPGLTEIAVECNHSLEQLARSDLPEVVRERARRTHFALENVCAWLVGLDLRHVRRIWLLHLSAAHADAAGFQRAVRQVTGVETVVCPE
jgi:phosphoribosyl 1,2-cyclic phosphodiesterase